MAYRWPGNIRELKNVVERIVLKTAGRAVTVADLPPEVVQTAALRAGGGGNGGPRCRRLGRARMADSGDGASGAASARGTAAPTNWPR